jgi:murein DD-endopeptidase MepM/ murein hydrolase activator NlpD
VFRTGRIAALFALALVIAAAATSLAAGDRSRPASAVAQAYARQDTSGALHDAVSVDGSGKQTGRETQAQASTTGGKAAATAAATVAGVNVFDGLVTADQVRVRASATASGGSTSGSISGLAIAGTPKPAPGGRTVYDLNGYGQMVALGSGASGILGLSVHLTKAYKGNPAGATVLIAYASAKARDAVAAPVAKPKPAAKPKASHSSKKKAKKHRKHRKQVSAAQKLQNALTQRELNWQAGLLTRNGYAFPVAGEHNFSDTFGAPRSDVPVHVGNDIFAAFGTPIVAVADGRIYRVGTLKIAGNRLWLRDGKGYRYFYAHLSDFAAAAYNGADVHAGEVIGFVGNTGDAEPTPPHLHFEVHMPDGAVVDPFPYLQKWDASGVTSESWLRRYGKDPGVRPGALVVVKDFLAEG